MTLTGASISFDGSGPPAPSIRPRPRTDWSRLAIPVATLCAAGASLALFARTLVMEAPAREDFLVSNALGEKARGALLMALLLGAGAPFVGAAISLLFGRARAAVRLERAADVAGPLIPICLLLALFSIRFGHHSQTVYLVLLSVFVFACEPLLRRSLTAMSELDLFPGPVLRGLAGIQSRAWPSSRVVCVALVLLAAAGYAAYMGFFTIRHHRQLGTTAFDLGIYDNLMYNAMHGRLFHSPVLFGPAGGNYLAGHAEFAMLLFVPLYAIRPGPETMLIMQAVFLGFAALPLYLFAATKLSRPAAATVAIAYLLFAPLHGPNFYDFHWLPLAIFFHFWLYYGIATRKNWLTGVMLVILYAFREDVAVGLAVLGLFLLLTGVRPRLGLFLLITSTVWFGIVRFVIMPRAGAWYFQTFYVTLFAEGVATFGAVFKTILSNPLYFLTTLVSEGKLQYALHMYAPLAFLPLRRPALILLGIPGFIFTIMTTGYGPTVAISFQYTTHWIPYLFLGTVLALIVISSRPDGVVARRAALATLAIALLVHSFNYGAILQRETFVGGFGRIEFKSTPADLKKYAELKELLAMIPRSASVAATEQETAHVSTRKTVYPLRWPPGPVDYLLVGRSHVGELSRAPLNAAMADPQAYGLVAARGEELFLFKRGHVSPDTKAARWKLGLP